MNQDDLTCPCCTKYIYDLYQCANKHNICGDCWIKVKACPICRDNKFNDCNSQIKDIQKYPCKNKECSVMIYDFDDDHPKTCFHNSFDCKFCNSAINNVVDHYTNYCINQYQVLFCPYKPNKETKGKKFKLSGLLIKPTWISIGDQYHIILMPKSTDGVLNVYIFSTNATYKYSDYKIAIRDLNNNVLVERNIIYKRFEPNILDLKKISDSDKLNFIIENMFLIDPKTDKYSVGNTFYMETHTVEGEPGGAGNWRKSDFDQAVKEFKNIFSKQ